MAIYCLAHILAYKGCFLTDSPIFSGRVARLVTCWFQLGRLPMPMFIKSDLKAVHGGCIDSHNLIWKLILCVEDVIAESICPNIEPRSSFMQYKIEWPLVAVY